METKHTAGPWTFKHGDICGPDDADGDDRVLAAVGVSYGLRSSVYSTVRKGPEMEANARLICAAPDLLAELQRMVEHFEVFAQDHSMEASTETWAALHCAKSAIRTATGAS